MNHRLSLAVAMLIFSIGSSLGAEQKANSVSQWGITWTFSQEHTVGQYANGDWWVLGPVTISSISPESVTVGGWTRNGTQVNPAAIRQQGFDSSPKEFSVLTGITWTASLNQHPSFTGSPLVLGSGSVVSSISRDRAAGRPQLDSLAILTVVKSIPAENSFRPGPSEDGNTDRVSFWNAEDLDYGLLHQLTPVSEMPTLSEAAAMFERPWVEFFVDGEATYIRALQNQPGVGSEGSKAIGEGLLVLHADYTNMEKRSLYIRMVQLGIDIYSAAQSGVVWRDLSATNPGRKAPLVLAALALEDEGMAAYADASQHFIFQEDLQTWYITEADVGRTLYTGDFRQRDPYVEADLGLAEWGDRHTSNPDRDGRNWNIPYRDICNCSLVTHALAMRLTAGAVELWNWPAFFDYHDRAFDLDQSSAGKRNYMEVWERDAWLEYREVGPVESPLSWGGYPINAEGFFNTGDWLGWFFVEQMPWLYSYSLDGWIYVKDPGAEASGVWAFVRR